MAYLAGKLWKPEEQTTFSSMLSSVKKLDPRASDLMVLYEVTRYSKHPLIFRRLKPKSIMELALEKLINVSNLSVVSITNTKKQHMQPII